MRIATIVPTIEPRPPPEARAAEDDPGHGQQLETLAGRRRDGAQLRDDDEGGQAYGQAGQQEADHDVPLQVDSGQEGRPRVCTHRRTCADRIASGS